MPTEPNWEAAVSKAAADAAKQIGKELERHGCLPILKEQKAVIVEALHAATRAGIQWSAQLVSAGVDIRAAAESDTWERKPAVVDDPCERCLEQINGPVWIVARQRVCAKCAKAILDAQ